MFGSTIIDVAIGVVFVFFLLSVVASHVNDLIAKLMDWRSKDLDRHIRQMLADPELANKVMNHPLVTGLQSKPGRTPSYIPSNTFALAVFEALVPSAGKQTVIGTVRTEVAKTADSNIQTVVLSMMERAEGNLEKARADFGQWFDQSMERLTDAYKRRMQVLTLVVATSITLIFGVDSLEIANTLYREPGVRAALAGAAQAAQAQQTTLKDAVGQLQGEGFPIGWRKLPTDALGWFQKIVGLVFTALAVSLGAPFWFDLLKNLSSVRGAVSPPASAAPPPATKEEKK